MTPPQPHDSRSLTVSVDLLEQIMQALDTANGCLQLVKAGTHITDLAECHDEILAAYDDLGSILDEHNPQIDEVG